MIDAAVAGHPTGKPHVERAVPYVRENFYRGEHWMGLKDMQQGARRWCLEVAGQRIHGTTHQRPLVVFEEQEKKALRPIAGERFDTPSWAECNKVHADHHIQFCKALYSVPNTYLGKHVTVRGDRALVRIFYKGKLIKTHPVQKPGGRRTDYEDYPLELQPYARRDPERMIRQARKMGTETGRFMEQLLAGPFPWCMLRQAQKLIRLGDKYGPERLEDACQRALAFELLNVKRVERILLKGYSRDRAAEALCSSQAELVPLPARFLRPKESFIAQPRKKEENDGCQNDSENGAQETQTIRDSRHVARPHRLCPEDETA